MSTFNPVAEVEGDERLIVFLFSCHVFDDLSKALDVHVCVHFCADWIALLPDGSHRRSHMPAALIYRGLFNIGLKTLQYCTANLEFNALSINKEAYVEGSENSSLFIACEHYDFDTVIPTC